MAKFKVTTHRSIWIPDGATPSEPQFEIVEADHYLIDRGTLNFVKTVQSKVVALEYEVKAYGPGQWKTVERMTVERMEEEKS